MIMEAILTNRISLHPLFVAPCQADDVIMWASDSTNDDVSFEDGVTSDQGPEGGPCEVD